MATIAAVAAVAVTLVLRLVSPVPLLGLLVEAALLKCAFSLRDLDAAAGMVGGELGRGDLEGARRVLAFHLVSRPTAGLDAPGVASGAVESLAENLTDSWVAPLCFFLVGGVPAAWAYRVINTADAMIGYREGRLEYLGKFAARADDVLNWVPARVAALSLVAAAWLAGESARGAWQTWRDQGRRTASPNAGCTMAAMAGALGVTVAKAAHYRLGDGPPPDVAVIDRARAVARRAAALTLLAALIPLAHWSLR